LEEREATTGKKTGEGGRRAASSRFDEPDPVQDTPIPDSIAFCRCATLPALSPKRLSAATTSAATMSAEARIFPTALTSSRLPPDGPFRSRMRVASMTVRWVGRRRLRSTRHSESRKWICPRLPPITPIMFFMPRVTFAREWCFATGTLMILSASRASRYRSHSESTSASGIEVFWNFRSSTWYTRNWSSAPFLFPNCFTASCMPLFL
jgi:hypothetical protein